MISCPPAQRASLHAERLQSPAAAAIRQIERQRRVTAGLPDSQVGEQRRKSSSRPEQNQIEEARIACAEQYAYAVDGCAQQQRQQILRQEEGLQGEDHVEQERRIGHTPPH